MMGTPDLSPGTMEKLARVFAAYPELTEVKLFGSRATGKATARSDIDLATLGISDDCRLGRLALDLEDTAIPQKCDLKAYESISYPPIKRHIDTYGITIYRKSLSAGDGAQKSPLGDDAKRSR